MKCIPPCCWYAQTPSLPCIIRLCCVSSLGAFGAHVFANLDSSLVVNTATATSGSLALVSSPTYLFSPCLLQFKESPNPNPFFFLQTPKLSASCSYVFISTAGFQQTEYRVIVTGLPPSASWQDLKDHMRKAGEPTYTDVVSCFLRTVKTTSNNNPGYTTHFSSCDVFTPPICEETHHPLET